MQVQAAREVPPGVAITMGSLTALQGVDYLQGPDGASVPVSALEGKTVMIYIAAKSCDAFTKKLATFYSNLSDAKHFEIVFASLDQTREAFDEHVKEHPWLALPYGAGAQLVEQLSASERLTHVPTLLVFGPDGALITREGKKCLEQDPEGAKFPWIGFSPKSISPGCRALLFFVACVIAYALEKEQPKLSISPSPPSQGSRAFSECYDSFVAGNVPSQFGGSTDVCSGGVVAISYDGAMINPSWSAYHINPSDIESPVRRQQFRFYADPYLTAAGVTQAAVDSDVFKVDGWDRGHLAPSRILSRTVSTQYATFTMANVAPQAPAFNSGPWNTLEKGVFDWISIRQRSLYIVTGVAYSNRRAPRRSSDNVAVPEYFWKVLCDPAARQSVGFIGTNLQSGYVESFTVQQVERLYGGTIFPAATCNTGRVQSTYWQA